MYRFIWTDFFYNTANMLTSEELDSLLNIAVYLVKRTALSSQYKKCFKLKDLLYIKDKIIREFYLKIFIFPLEDMSKSCICVLKNNSIKITCFAVIEEY